MNRRTAVRVIAGGSTLALGLRDLLRPQPSAAQASAFTTNFPVPVDFVFSDCAGEPVHMTGVMHQLVHFTNITTPSFRFTLASPAQPQPLHWLRGRCAARGKQAQKPNSAL